MPVKYKIIFDDIQALFSLFLQSLKEQELTDAVKYVSRSPDIIESIRSSLRYQPSKVSIIFVNYIMIEPHPTCILDTLMHLSMSSPTTPHRGEGGGRVGI